MNPKQIEHAAKTRGVRMSVILRAANVAHSTWWRWKHGKHSPSLAVVDRITKALEQKDYSKHIKPRRK
jgi:transcriptional regulator with XRE-family HTH domain